MKNLNVGKRLAKKIKSGVDLIDSRDVENLKNLPDQDYARLFEGKNFLGIAYFSKQNKGAGWLINRRDELPDLTFWLNLFTKAKSRRSRYYEDTTTNAFRLFNQDGDGFGGLTIDLYKDYAVFSWYNSFVYNHKDEILAAFKEIFPEVLGAYEKLRFKEAEFESAHLYGQKEEDKFLIQENGVNYSVFLNDGLMTGIFLDQHDVRDLLISGLACGKTVLNTFSYTAAFSLAAMAGGAIESVSVDLAKRSRELSEDNFKANNFNLDNNKFVVMDIFEYFKYAKRHNLKFDVIVLDPPSFARNKKQTFSVAKDYHKLISQSLDILSNQGMIIASTNAQNLSLDKFKEQIDLGMNGQGYTIEQTLSLPEDFRYNHKDKSSDYLKVNIIKVN